MLESPTQTAANVCRLGSSENNNEKKKRKKTETKQLQTSELRHTGLTDGWATGKKAKHFCFGFLVWMHLGFLPAGDGVWDDEYASRDLESCRKDDESSRELERCREL